MTIKRINKQKGLTVIELMVAMIIGVFLLMGVSSVYLSNMKSSKTRDQYSLLEDNARLALDSMSKVIQHTGFSTSLDIPILPSKFITADVSPDTSCSNGHALFTANQVTKDADTGDSIGVVYIGNAPYDKDGNLLTNGTAITNGCSGKVMETKCRKQHPDNTSTDNRKSYIYNAFSVDAYGKLQCTDSLDAEKQVIADGIENMQITYGVDTDGSGTANKYVNASNINLTEWNGVVSVQIAVLVRSKQEIKDVAEQRTYSLLDKTITAPSGTGAKDRYQRAVFNTTVYLRNN